jgi:phosphoribosylaminoimidazole (AIR) synthetase
MMPEDEYDLAGFAVGFVEYDDIIDGSAIEMGDVLLGLALCVSTDDADAVMSALRGGGETPLIIGRCIGGDKGVELTW